MAYVPLSRLNQVPELEGEYPEFSMFGELRARGLYVRHAKNITINNVILRLEKKYYRPVFVFHDLEGLVMQNIGLPAGRTNQVVYRKVDDASLDSSVSAQKYEVRYPEVAVKD